MTDTAKLADLVLPATSQLEQTDLHRGYGHTLLGYNHPAITPLGESKSNWQVMQLLSKAMGYEDDWLHQSVDEVIDEILHASRNNTARLDHITLDTLKRQPYVAFASADEVPFSDSVFDTPSGKVELASSVFQELGQSALPTWNGNSDNKPGNGYCIDYGSQLSFQLLSPAAHHFVNSSLANMESLVRKEKQPVVLLHPEDIKQLKLNEGDLARLYNHRGYCLRNVRSSTDVLPGVAVAIVGFWATQAEHSTVNWTTSDHLADVAGQSTFHSNRVWIVAE
jgi:anaerobic selenocysteine-containing dehydrogenase